jgi:ABC-type uncharacterized transport system auxiliary subunit
MGTIMSRRLREKGILVFAACAALATGCVHAPPVRYYQLDMNPSGKAEPAVNIEIERLTATDDLARRDILIQKDATEIEYYADAQWSVNVPDQVRRKLEAEFGPYDADKPAVTISGEVRAFEQVDLPGGAAGRVALHLRLSRDGETVGRKVYTSQVAADRPDPKAVAQALSRALETIAREIAADAGALAKD